MAEEDKNMTLKEMVDRFRNFAAGKLRLYYSFRTLALFFSGMGTTRFAILEGISGTGKTSLPYAFGKFFRNRSPIVAVRPDASLFSAISRVITSLRTTARLVTDFTEIQLLAEDGISMV